MNSVFIHLSCCRVQSHKDTSYPPAVLCQIWSFFGHSPHVLSTLANKYTYVYISYEAWLLCKEEKRGFSTMNALPIERLRVLHTHKQISSGRTGGKALWVGLFNCCKRWRISATWVFLLNTLCVTAQFCRKETSFWKGHPKWENTQSKITKLWRGEGLQQFSYPTSSGFSWRWAMMDPCSVQCF